MRELDVAAAAAPAKRHLPPIEGTSAVWTASARDRAAR